MTNIKVTLLSRFAHKMARLEKKINFYELEEKDQTKKIKKNSIKN